MRPPVRRGDCAPSQTQKDRPIRPGRLLIYAKFGAGTGFKPAHARREPAVTAAHQSIRRRPGRYCCAGFYHSEPPRRSGQFHRQKSVRTRRSAVPSRERKKKKAEISCAILHTTPRNWLISLSCPSNPSLVLRRSSSSWCYFIAGVAVVVKSSSAVCDIFV